MSTHSPYHDETPPFRFPATRQPSENPFGQEYKPPYEDGSDDYVFGINQGHQTYNVDTHTMYTGEHRRGSSHPLQNAPYVAKQSTDALTIQTSRAYPPLAPVKDEVKGFWKRILPESMACRLYLLTVLIETTVDLAIEGDLLVRVRHETENETDHQRMSAYLSIFAFAHVFQFIMALDAVYARNTLQFIFLTVFNALFLLYAIIQIKEVQEAVNVSSPIEGTARIPINVLTTIIPVVISLSEVAYIALGWKIYHEFGWKVYKFLGANRRIKKMYAKYQIYECLVKFDIFFWAGFSVQFLWLVLRTTDWEYYVTCAALPLSLVLLVEGHLAAKHENRLMMATFMSGCVGAMIYFLYKMVKVLNLKSTEEFRFIWKTLTAFSVIAIVLLFATFVFSIVVLRNFGKGLKDTLTKSTGHTRDPSRPLASTNPNRMSID